MFTESGENQLHPPTHQNNNHDGNLRDSSNNIDGAGCSNNKISSTVSDTKIKEEKVNSDIDTNTEKSDGNDVVKDDKSWSTFPNINNVGERHGNNKIDEDFVANTGNDNIKTGNNIDADRFVNDIEDDPGLPNIDTSAAEDEDVDIDSNVIGMEKSGDTNDDDYVDIDNINTQKLDESDIAQEKRWSMYQHIDSCNNDGSVDDIKDDA